MTITIGEWISQIRNQTKVVNPDNRYISNRLVFSLIKKHTALFIYREDANMKISRIRFIYSVLPYVELVDVDRIDAGCKGIKSGCTIKRTKNKLPPLLKGYYTPLMGEVSSIDGQDIFNLTTPSQYVNKANSPDFKYNTAKYYWIISDYAYFPNIIWDAVKMEVVLDSEALDDCGEIDPCAFALNMEFGVPPYLMSAIQAEVLKDLSFLIQTPKDPITDKQSTT